MSAAIASRRRPSRIASAIRGSSSTINTRMRSDAARSDISSTYRKTHTFWQHHATFTSGVAYSQPARPAARWSRPTVYRARRRRLLLGVVLFLLLAHTAGQLLNDTGHVRMPTAHTHNDPPAAQLLTDTARVRVPPPHPHNAPRRTDVPAVSWPQQGQAALVLGNGR